MGSMTQPLGDPDLSPPVRRPRSTGRVPGQVLLQPAVLGALGLLVVNDHLLKPWLGNGPTGKLSDAAGVFVVPLVLLGLVEWARWVIRREHWAARHAELVAAVGVTAVGFTAVKLVPFVAGAYVAVIGGLRWLGESAIQVVAGEGLASFAPVGLVRDPSDLWTLPVLLVSYVVARHGVEPAPDRAAAVRTS
jgi:hypothetical protein